MVGKNLFKVIYIKKTLIHIISKVCLIGACCSGFRANPIQPSYPWFHMIVVNHLNLTNSWLKTTETWNHLYELQKLANFCLHNKLLQICTNFLSTLFGLFSGCYKSKSLYLIFIYFIRVKSWSYRILNGFLLKSYLENANGCIDRLTGTLF